MTSSVKVDRVELETKVQDMYRAVPLHPEGEFHFEMGRQVLGSERSRTIRATDSSPITPRQRARSSA